MYVEREVTNHLRKSLSGFSSVAVTGARQTGKSTLLKKLFGSEYQYVSFDDILVRERAINDPALFMTEIIDKAIFDEIQYVPHLLSYLKIEIDNDRAQPGKYLLTGSQQFSVMKGLSETMAGRVALLNLHPFSYTELATSNIFKRSSLNTERFYSYACLVGLYPELCVNKKIEPRMWYSSYVQTYLEKVIKSIYNIGDLRTFGQFLRILAARCSQIVNYSSISKEIGVSVGTVKSWISILEASQIIYLMNPYHEDLGKRIIKSPKIYWLDTGMVCYLTGIQNEEQIRYGIMAGALFENLVISETLKFLNNNGLFNNIFFLRTSNNQEIDLLIQSGEKIYPFEIKISKTPKPAMVKSIQSITKLFPGLNMQRANLICMTEKAFPLTKDANAINFQEYLDFLGKFTSV